MNRVVEVLKEMQSESSVRLEACIKQMVEMNSKITSDKKSTEEGQEENETEQEVVSKPKPISTNQTVVKVNQTRSQSSSGARWPPTSGPSGNVIDDDMSSGPSWDFVSKERVDEVFEDCENYKIFARKISYAIFDEHEQRLKMNERNKKKVSELRKIIRLKYPSERREFDDMIWRTCKNAVNNTTYNEAKRRKRHPALMLGTESSGQNYLSGTYEVSEHMGTPSKRLFDSGHESFLKSEPTSEFSEL
ncbi:hypothetical protein FO519_009506 [Halicephalobus sp. NKZ332]|nr:hypothetical protein FO519_009506 [Halicephalobus sp. NKZ332]